MAQQPYHGFEGGGGPTSGQTAAQVQAAIIAADKDKLIDSDDSIRGVAPTTAQFSSPPNPSTAVKLLQDGTVEIWNYDGTWSLDSTTEPPIQRVFDNAGALSGAAPTGAVFGIDTTNNTIYKVEGGNWEIIPVSSSEMFTPSVHEETYGFGSKTTVTAGHTLKFDLNDGEDFELQVNTALSTGSVTFNNVNGDFYDGHTLVQYTDTNPVPIAPGLYRGIQNGNDISLYPQADVTINNAGVGGGVTSTKDYSNSIAA